MRVRFRDCVLDSEARELVRAGKPVHLSPKGFDLLLLLLDRRPAAVPKSEVHENLWRGTFVSDGTLTSLVAEVRSAIGDSDQTRQIRTVHRFGYAFAGAAETWEAEKRPRPEFAYRLLGPLGREVALCDGETIVGRDPLSTVFLDDASVSRRHARIRISAGKATVEDLHSKNGTSLAEKKIAGPHALHDGDVLGFGSIHLTYRVFPLSGSTETAGQTSRRSGAKSNRAKDDRR